MSLPPLVEKILRIVWLPLGTGLLVWLLSLTPLARQADYWLGDAQQQLAASERYFDDALVVDIDETSLRALRPYFGDWPYRRDAYALVVDFLGEMGAQAVVLDILLADVREGDASLRRALLRNGKVVLAASAVAHAHELDETGRALLAAQAWPANGPLPAMHWPAVTLPHAGVMGDADEHARVGVISAEPDEDGLLRRIPLMHDIGGHYLPSLPLAALLTATAAPATPGVPIPNPEVRFESGLLRVGERAWPVDAQGMVRLAFPRNGNSVLSMSFAQLAGAALGLPGQVLDKAALHGKTVFIGGTGALIDRVTTPSGGMAGTYVVATAHEALKHGLVLKPPVWYWNALLLALALVPAFVTVTRSVRFPLLSEGGLPLATAGVVYALNYGLLRLQQQQSILLAPLLAIVIAHVLVLVRHQFWLRQRNAVLAQERAVADAANRAKSEFLASMSHELRTPMNAILGFSQIMESDQTLSKENRESVTEILKAGRHLLELINELLDLAKVESGQIQLTLEPVAVAAMARECQALVATLAHGRGIRITLGEFGAQVVQVDRMRFKQVLLNLLSNAIKYNREGGTVRVEARPGSEGRLRIEVSDTGHGIPADRLAELFQPFNRLDAEHSAIEGTGIGLSITKRIVELMGGAVDVHSVVGQGSTFSIELPLAVQPEPVAQAQEAPVAVSSTEAPAAQYTVLYIEDNPSNMRLMAQILGKHSNLRLLTAPLPEVGLEMAGTHRPDLILLDINMPGMDGYQVLEVLKSDARFKATPVLAITAVATPREVERGMAAGFAAYITKPLDVRKFLQTIEAFLPESVGAARARP